MRLVTGVAAAVAAAAVVLAITGCGGGTTTTVTDHQTTTVFLPATGGSSATAVSDTASSGGSSTSSGGGLDFQMGEFFYKPAQTSVAGGSVKVTVDNIGAAPHEWVLAKTNLDPANLPTLPSGEVDEDKLDSPGEIADVAAGASADSTLKLTPGKYVYFCNLPGHYSGGMYGGLDVTGG